MLHLVTTQLCKGTVRRETTPHCPSQVVWPAEGRGGLAYHWLVPLQIRKSTPLYHMEWVQQQDGVRKRNMNQNRNLFASVFL